MPNFALHHIKIVLLAFVVIYAVVGTILIIVSQVTKSNLYGVVEEQNLSYEVGGKVGSLDASMVGTWLIITSFWIWGIVILVFSAYGAVSIVLEKPTHIKAFAFLLLIVSSMKIPVIAYTMYICGHWDAIMILSKTSLEGNFLLTATDKDSKAAFDFVQEWHSCCGVSSYKDYDKINKNTYPESCCYIKSGDCHSSNDVYQDGCAESVALAYLRKYRIVAGMTLFVTILEVLATVLAFRLQWRTGLLKGSR